jgi:hypothetical protein
MKRAIKEKNINNPRIKENNINDRIKMMEHFSVEY